LSSHLHDRVEIEVRAGRILADLIVGADPAMDLAPFALERLASAVQSGERYVV